MSEERKRLHVLRDYAAGRLGTREAIRRAGLDDYADLIIALVRHDLDLPKPADTPERRAKNGRAPSCSRACARRAHRDRHSLDLHLVSGAPK